MGWVQSPKPYQQLSLHTNTELYCRDPKEVWTTRTPDPACAVSQHQLSCPQAAPSVPMMHLVSVWLQIPRIQLQVLHFDSSRNFLGSHSAQSMASLLGHHVSGGCLPSRAINQEP